LSEGMKLRYLNPKDIKIPDVRVTSYFDEELRGLFQHSIRELGIQEPILVAKDDSSWILVDGKNRLEEALLNGITSIPCAIMEISLSEVLLKNLTLNTLRGKVKPKEMLKVVNTLYEEYHMEIDEIASKSGLRRDHVEKLLSIARCTDRIIAALDENLISVSHAYEISQIEQPDVQERLLGQCLQYRLNVKDLHDIVQETKRILLQRRAERAEGGVKAQIEIPTARCELCEQNWPIKRVAGVNLCVGCYGIAQEAVREKIAELRIKSEAELEKQRARLAEATKSQQEE